MRRHYTICAVMIELILAVWFLRTASLDRHCVNKGGVGTVGQRHDVCVAEDGRVIR